ncbi:MAG: glycosyltransferase family 39 protein [Sandaracinaceae bacterium]|nr:glycosyltransferase family 39 protein [Sandaracinaceae bacterium]
MSSDDKKRGKRSAKKKASKPPAQAKTVPAVIETEAPTSRGEPKKKAPFPAHLWRGPLVMTVGIVPGFLLMASERQIPGGPGLGIVFMLIAVVGLLDALGLFRPNDEGRTLAETPLFALEGELAITSPIFTVPLSLLALIAGIVAGGYDGLPITLAISLALLLPSAARRPGLLVFVVAGLLYLPTLGVYGLWDPWETHYGEVAREILSRNDWISLWWAQEDWFWSKPILIFWAEALSMGALGVDFHPDANPLHPEWAIRLPHFLLTVGALVSLYLLVSRVWSKRAGLIAALVLMTMPYFFFLAHQAITDMPFVSTMTMAMAMLGLALREDPKNEIRGVALGRTSISLKHVVIGAIAIVVLPQALYLFSRNVTLVHEPSLAFAWHADTFMSGSAGNHDVPGNRPGSHVEPFLSGPAAQPMAQGLLWLGLFGLLVFFASRERRTQSLYMLAFYFFCGLSFMAKGIPGFALPGLVALLWLLATKRWDVLLEGRLRVGLGILTVVTVGMPWYVAMYVRHGPAFTDRLLIHDHINRLTAGVHGDTGSIEYFTEQLGYGTFPWIVLAPLALAGFMRWRRKQSRPADAVQRQTILLFGLWLAAAFTLFTAMTTKFHHYIFPAVPAAAMLVGIGLDQLLAPAEEGWSWRRFAATLLAVLAPVPLVLGVAGLWGDVRGVMPPAVATTPQHTEWVMQHPWSTAVCASLIALGVLSAAAASFLSYAESRRSRKDAPWRPSAATLGLVVGPVLLGFVGRDLSWVTDARPQGYERLIHLFVYNYGRPWPDQLDYRPILTGFAIVAVVLGVGAALGPLRRTGLIGLLGLGLMFAAWSLDVYLIDLSPHWGQRELIQRYYERRASDEEPLVAWQMNWKGENFYTGNRVAVFVQLENREINQWVSENRGRTAFFILEHGRLGSLRSILHDSTVEEVTGPILNNKFILVRAPIGVRQPPPVQLRGH